MPVLYVIAGPNGIGKTTACYDLVPAETPIINSDEIAKEIRQTHPSHVNLQEYSNEIATKLMDMHLMERKTFAIETNLADIDTWKFLLEVQKQGYSLHILYISTDNIPMLNSRIEARTLLGDHFVHPQVVRERYISGLNLLNHYFQVPDRLQLIDNSERPLVVLEAVKGQIVYTADHLPQWVEPYLKHNPEQQDTTPPIKELNDIEDVRKRYDQLRSNT